MKKLKIGEILVRSGNITQEQLETALKKQEAEGGLLGEILIRLGYIDENYLIKALTEQADVHKQKR